MKTKIIIFSLLLCICNFQISAQLNDTTIGDALNLGGNCFLITPEGQYKAGGVWYDNPIDFSNDFTIYYQNNFGDIDATGADGMALVFKTTPDPVIGRTANGLGYLGINNSLIVEFDTFENGDVGDPYYDHLAIMKNGNVTHNSADNLAGPVQASSLSANIEDGIFHDVKVQWDATTQVFSVFFDCELRLTITEDIKNTIFGGDSSVFFGFVGSTGWYVNRQVVCFNSISFVENLVVPENENICLGQEINIDATIPSGNSYSWSPTIGVSDAEIANPDFSPTETTDYTVTIADNCGELTNYTVTIAVSSISTPTFAQIAAICVGDNLPDLPTTSTNGISGTWSPAMNNIATTTYAFTPDAGECSTDLAEMTVIVNTSITPTFTQVAAIFNGETLAALPTTSNNNITGTWSPAINNTETTTYTFTPDASQTCAINQTMMITVTQSACEGSSGNQLVNPSFEVPEQTNIGNNIQSWPLNGWNGVGSAPNVVKVNGVAGQGGPISAQDGVQYLDISGGSADFYQEFDFQCNTQVFFSGYFSVRDGQSSTGRIDILRVNSDNTTDVVASSNQLDMPSTANIWYLASGDVVLPKGTYRFQISMGNHSNVDSTCFSFDYPNIDTGSYDPLCESSSSITLTGTPTDSFGTWTGSGVVDNGDGTASFNPSGLGGTAVTATYSHFNASGFGCSQSTNITVNLNTPTFTQVAAICNGEVLAVLPTTSTNGVTGTWSPALDNTATTIYTFVPDATQPGQACAVNQTMTITVNPLITPTFTQVYPICNGEALAVLTTTSDNGITGIWSPAIDNTATTLYTFVPDATQPGQTCVVNQTMTITVNPLITPTFTQVDPICNGEALGELPTTSNNGVTGTWSPAMDNTATTIYTFAPDTTQPGQACAVNQTMTITVNPLITPTFSQVDPICNGDVLALPITSNNGLTGTWSPAIDNTATTLYTFVPDATQPGQACAVNQTMTITVNQTVIPIFDSVAAICEGESLTNLPTTSNNSIKGTWSPAINNTETTNYTFTPDAGQCAITSSIDIVVNPIITPFFNKVNPIRSGDTLNNLPSTSNNGIEGTWSPAMNNTATTNYTFTPNPGQCAATSNIEIVISNINNAFSPNGDGVNDIFIIPILFNYLDFEIEVFNRWGTKVYYYNNNGSTSPSWWDGYATVGLLQGSSKPLTVGTYYYIIHLNNKVKEKITGWIYLNR